MFAVVVVWGGGGSGGCQLSFFFLLLFFMNQVMAGAGLIDVEYLRFSGTYLGGVHVSPSATQPPTTEASPVTSTGN